MSNEEKVVNLTDQTEEKELETNEKEDIITDPDNPLDNFDERAFINMMKQIRDMVEIMESQWLDTKKDFQLQDSHMKQLYQYNEEHRELMPDNLSTQEQDDWDHFNGIDGIDEETLLNIFGEDHPITNVPHELSVSRVKDAIVEFFGWMTALKEYRQVNDAYLQLVEEGEEKEIKKLQLIMEKEEDPEKKAKMQESVDLYFERKYLGFMAVPQDEETINRLTSAFSDKKKIEYWLNRAQDKMKQLNISTKFILEISQFEKRFLPDKYHKLSNMILLYFLQTIVYCNCGDKNDHNRNKAVCMIFALDKICRKPLNCDTETIILDNLKKFLDQFIDKVNYDTAVNEKYNKPV